MLVEMCSSYCGSVGGDDKPANNKEASAIIAEAVSSRALGDGHAAAQNALSASFSVAGSDRRCGNALAQQAASAIIAEAMPGTALVEDVGDTAPQDASLAIVAKSLPELVDGCGDASAQHTGSAIVADSVLGSDGDTTFQQAVTAIVDVPVSRAVYRGSDGDESAQHTVSTIVGKAVSGSHVLKVKGYSQTKGIGAGGILSDTFGVGGHYWSIVYYPDGCNSDYADWLSIGLVLMDSNASLVKAKFKFSLLDHAGKPVQLYTTETHRWKTLSSHEPSGSPRFIESKTLESTYLKDDCLMVRFDITVAQDIRIEATTKQSVVIPPSDIHQHLGKLLLAGKGTDVTFEVSGETFAAHRCVLAARSPVFMAELYGPMKENTATCIRIDALEPMVFKALLHFIYTDMLPEMDIGDDIFMAQHLLVAADRYDLKRLKAICEDMLCNNINTETAASTLALAEQHNCRGLKEECFKFLVSRGNNLELVMTTDAFEHLWSSCPSVIEELLAKLDANARSANP